MEENMWNLVWCDIFRDGGSLGAVLRRDSENLSLFLQVAPWDKPPQIMEYKSLWVSKGESPDHHGEEISAGSDSEREWLWELENNVRTDTAQECYRYSQEHFSNLLAALRRRNN